MVYFFDPEKDKNYCYCCGMPVGDYDYFCSYDCLVDFCKKSYNPIVQLVAITELRKKNDLPHCISGKLPLAWEGSNGDEGRNE